MGSLLLTDTPSEHVRVLTLNRPGELNAMTAVSVMAGARLVPICDLKAPVAESKRSIEPPTRPKKIPFFTTGA